MFADRDVTSRLRSSLLLPAIVAGALLLGASTAHAAVETVLPRGLTETAGLALAPDGALWVSDGNFGVCKLNLDLSVSPAVQTDPALFAQDGQWCRDHAVVPPAPAPGSPTQMVFDPASSSFYVGDSDANAGAVWRLHWDPTTHTIDSGDRVVTLAGDRIFGVALAPDGSIDFSGKRGGTIRRYSLPACAAPPCLIGSTVGEPPAGAAPEAAGGGLGQLTHLGAALYVVEAANVSTIASPAIGDGQPTVAIANFPGGVPSAVAADAATGRVYAGTASHASIDDQVDVLDVATGAIETYVTGFSSVTGLMVAPDGTLYVADDPSSAAGTIGVVGQGRLRRIATTPLGRPHVGLLEAPPTYTNALTLHFRYGSAADTTFACTQDGGPSVACGTGPEGTFDMTGVGGAPIDEGLHTLDVVATDANHRSSDPLRRTVVVDRTPPQVTVDNPASDASIARSTLTLRFSADDSLASFACSLDGADPGACGAPLTLRNLSLGRHTFSVSATDLAGNVGAPATFDFEVLPAPLPPVVSPAGPSGAGQPSVVAPTSTATAAGRPATASASAPRACLVAAAPAIDWARWADDGHSVALRIAPIATSRRVRVTIRKLHPLTKHQTRGRPLFTAILPGRATLLTWRLTPVQRARLRSGQFVLAVSASGCGGRFGTARLVGPPRA
jgi:sugar lactone lactonase YvrE